MCQHSYEYDGFRTYGSNIPCCAQGAYFPGDEPGTRCTLTGDYCEFEGEGTSEKTEWLCPECQKRLEDSYLYKTSTCGLYYCQRCKKSWSESSLASAFSDLVGWLIAEVERLKAEKAQAEAERDALAAELKENWPFLGGVMYAAAEMVTNGMDATIPLDILMASGHWAEFEAHCNSCDVERFRQAVGEKCVNRLRRKPFSQQHAEKKGGVRWES